MNSPHFNYAIDNTTALLDRKADIENNIPQVKLTFARSPAGATYLSQQLAAYPYHIGRLLKNTNTPDQMAMLLFQCTSGGLFEHDRITLDIQAKEKAVASVKHAAATVVHSMQKGGYANVSINMVAERESYLEYIGNTNILFPDSELKNDINVSLSTNAIALISESYLTYDPTQLACHFKHLETSINVYDADKKLLMRDRFSIEGSRLADQLTAVNHQFDTHASIYLLMPNCDDTKINHMLDLINAAIVDRGLSPAEAYIGMGTLPNQCGVFLRLLSHSGEPVQTLITEIANKMRSRFLNN
jgi:urease accessory protein